MLELVKNKVVRVRQMCDCSYTDALRRIAEAEVYDTVEDYLSDALDYHDRLKFAEWLSFVE